MSKKKITIKDFIGDEVLYDEFGGTYLWGKKEGEEGMQMVGQIKGWGAIQHLFDTTKEAEDFHDEMGKFIAAAITEKLKGESIESLEAKRFAWAGPFFKNATAISSLYKLRTEIDEIEADLVAGIKRPEEFADAMMCLFDSAGRAGIFPGDIAKAFKEKLEVNLSSKWIDQGDGTYKRIKK